jgi:serine/threonine protein kinase
MTTTSEHTGTTRYLAPELVMSEESVPPTLASDVYALGCLGLEVSGYGFRLPQKLVNHPEPVHLPSASVLAPTK